MKRDRDRIEQLELAAANRAPQRRFNQEELLEAVKEVAIDGFPRFRVHVIEVLRLHGTQGAEDFAGLEQPCARVICESVGSPGRQRSAVGIANERLSFERPQRLAL
jgi:hypothetical protein